MITYLEGINRARILYKEPRVSCDHDDRRQFTLCNGSDKVRAWVCQHCGAEGIAE